MCMSVLSTFDVVYNVRYTVHACELKRTATSTDFLGGRFLEHV